MGISVLASGLSKYKKGFEFVQNVICKAGNI